MALTLALSAWDNVLLPNNGNSAKSSDIAHALAVTRQFLHPRDINTMENSARIQPGKEETEAVLVIKDRGLSKLVFNDFLDAMESSFYMIQSEIDACLLRIEEEVGTDPHESVTRILGYLFDRLAAWQRAWGVPLRILQDNTFVGTFTRAFHHRLHSSFPPSFSTILHKFFYASLIRLPSPPSSFGDTNSSSQPKHDRPLPPPPSPHLSRLGIFPRFSGILSRVAQDEIERIAREEASEGWEEKRLGRARERVGGGVASWLAGMFQGPGNEPIQGALRPMYSRFDYSLCKCFFDIRTEELFDVIVDFPDSMAALEDLKECIFKIDQRQLLIDRLTTAHVRRLLHPGAATSTILQLYVSTIRSLRILDPQGVLLHSVAGPIRDCLRKRADMPRAIVIAICTWDELKGSENDGGVIRDADEKAEDFLDPRWEPEPTDAAPEFRSGPGKSNSTFSLLVTIPKTVQAIIDELEVYLSEKLLQVKDYDPESVVEVVERMKMRFGDEKMAGCDVMIKDIKDSKRIDSHVQGDCTSVIHPLVLSKMFWPEIQRTSLTLPSKLSQMHQTYETAFHEFKPDKHLRFVPYLGSVSLTIALSDRTIDVDASPLQAALMELFEDDEILRVDDLADRLGLGKGKGEAEVVKALGWWAERGVVKDEGDGRWRLLELEEAEYDEEDHM